MAALSATTLLVFALLPARCEVLRGSVPNTEPLAELSTIPGWGKQATSPDPAINVTQFQARQKAADREPRIYFLFLAVDKVSNIEIWNRFFATADEDKYRAYVHCKLDSCKEQIKNTNIKVVQTVGSYYCTDLVSPMNMLIWTALVNDGHSANDKDKFVFISDSTLPAKPFSNIYSEFSSRQGSDFCIFPTSEWVDVPSNAGRDMVPKHFQWIALERAHAEKSTTLWGQGRKHDFMSHFKMNQLPWSFRNNSFGDSRNFGCLDEFWYWGAIFGYLHNVRPYQTRNVDIHGFAGSPLRVGAGVGWQGHCDTFVLWSQYLHNYHPNPFLDLYKMLDPASVPHSGNSARPGWWDTVSTEGLRVFRSSNFLFVRKFVDGPTLADGTDFVDTYTRIVLK